MQFNDFCEELDVENDKPDRGDYEVVIDDDSEDGLTPDSIRFDHMNKRIVIEVS
jgi:hypothetical protein